MLIRRFQLWSGRRRVPLTALLVFGLSALVFIAVAGVLVVTLGAAARNTIALLEDKGRLLLISVVERTRQFLDPAAAQAEFVARLIESGEIAPDQPEQLYGALRAALAATPQVHATVYLDASGWLITVERGTEAPTPEVGDWRNNPTATAVVEDAKRRRSAEAFWGPPVYISGPDTTVVNLRRPVLHGGRFVGLIASSITVRELSRFLVGLESEIGQNAFILYGRDKVLAHRALEWDFPGLDQERPLPALLETGDPVLAQIWREGYEDRRLVAGEGHQQELAGVAYIYLYTTLEAYGEVPWLVGSYFAEADVADQFQRLFRAGIVGLGALLLAVLFAVLIGRKVSRPIGDLAAAATLIRDLDIDQVPRLRHSRLREIDQAASAFNAMVGALGVFSLYVPKKVVHGLIRRRGVAAARRDVSVMFTDIVGFTRRVESLDAEDTAAFLNRHFELVAACVEAEDGIVDKYIGDGVMALWGALEDQPDHAARAVRAAGAIVRALRADNRTAAPPVRMRIGVHSGPVVVGNIGAPARMNFTVVGDTVNIAERLQTLGKAVAADAEAVVLVSAATAAGLDERGSLQSLGAHPLRGREEGVEVFRLDPAPDPAGGCATPASA